jgi:hypothetical protein
MSLRLSSFYAVLAAIAALAGTIRVASAQHHTSNVPPTLEIEVLDPNADPQGRPAVELGRDGYGNLIVDIPPVVLVHRYYYTGDRSFQAQLLPGGPSIVVVNHPKTGERCYIDVQMPPGAPRVTYTDHSIEYDFGKTGVSVVFGLFGHPSVKYRNGTPLHRQVGNLLHVEAVKQGLESAGSHLQQSTDRATKQAYGALVSVGGATKVVTLPAKNLLQMMPLGKRLFSDDLGLRLEETAAQHKRDAQVRRFEKQQARAELSLPTAR